MPAGRTQSIVQTALFTAIFAVLSQVSIPFLGGMPITLQTFAVVLLGIVEGSKHGLISVMLYLFLGFIGIPVFAGFRSGPSVLFGATGGYLFGFLVMVFLVGLGKNKHLLIKYVYCIAGLIACHIAGVAGYYLVTNSLLPTAPFLLIKDALTAIPALLIGIEMLKRLKNFPSFV